MMMMYDVYKQVVCRVGGGRPHVGRVSQMVGLVYDELDGDAEATERGKSGCM